MASVLAGILALDDGDWAANDTLFLSLLTIVYAKPTFDVWMGDDVQRGIELMRVRAIIAGTDQEWQRLIVKEAFILAILFRRNSKELGQYINTARTTAPFSSEVTRVFGSDYSTQQLFSDPYWNTAFASVTGIPVPATGMPAFDPASPETENERYNSSLATLDEMLRQSEQDVPQESVRPGVPMVAAPSPAQAATVSNPSLPSALASAPAVRPAGRFQQFLAPSSPLALGGAGTLPSLTYAATTPSTALVPYGASDQPSATAMMPYGTSTTLARQDPSPEMNMDAERRKSGTRASAAKLVFESEPSEAKRAATTATVRFEDD